MEKKFSELEEGVDYIDLDKRSFAERLPEIVEKEAIKGPRWIVFANYNRLGMGPTDEDDRWVVCESLEEALEQYREAISAKLCYSAGISAVVRSTDYDLVSSEEFSQAKLFLAGTPE